VSLLKCLLGRLLSNGFETIRHEDLQNLPLLTSHPSSSSVLEKRGPADRPLRAMREMTDAALKDLSPRFSRLYSETGRPWIPPEQLLRALVLQVLYTIRSERMLIEQLVEIYGRPAAIRCDNGPEFTAGTFSDWCEEQKIEVRYIQPGKPDQNAYIERFNRTYRGDVLDSWLVGSVTELQEISDEWLEDYNVNRPHDSLGGVPPAQFLPRPIARRESSFEVCP
jgi:hypothetical protein